MTFIIYKTSGEGRSRGSK